MRSGRQTCEPYRLAAPAARCVCGFETSLATLVQSSGGGRRVGLERCRMCSCASTGRSLWLRCASDAHELLRRMLSGLLYHVTTPCNDSKQDMTSIAERWCRETTDTHSLLQYCCRTRPSTSTRAWRTRCWTAREAPATGRSSAAGPCRVCHRADVVSNYPCVCAPGYGTFWHKTTHASSSA